MTTIAADHPAPTQVRRHWPAQLGIDSAYVLVGFPLGIIAFVLVLTGLAVGASLLPLFLFGVPLLVGTVYVARGLAEAERARLAPVLRRPRVAVYYTRARPGAKPLRRLLVPFTEVQYWLDALHALVRAPVNVATFSIVFSWWVVALGGLTYILWDWTLPQDPGGVDPPGLIVVNDVPLVEVFGLENTFANRVLVNTTIGLVFGVTLPFVVRLCALLEAWLAHALLNGVAGLRDQVALLARDRDAAQAQTAAAVSAEATALRRLERDIHDGPQQRLVRLAVDLDGPASSSTPTRPRRPRPSRRRSRRPGRRSTSCVRCRAASPRRSSPTVGWRRRSRPSPPARPYRSASTSPPTCRG